MYESDKCSFFICFFKYFDVCFYFLFWYSICEPWLDDLSWAGWWVGVVGGGGERYCCLFTVQIWYNVLPLILDNSFCSQNKMVDLPLESKEHPLFI